MNLEEKINLYLGEAKGKKFTKKHKKELSRLKWMVLHDSMGNQLPIKSTQVSDALQGYKGLLEHIIAIELGFDKPIEGLYFDGDDLIYNEEEILRGVVRKGLTLDDVVKVVKKHVK